VKMRDTVSSLGKEAAALKLSKLNVLVLGDHKTGKSSLLQSFSRALQLDHSVEGQNHTVSMNICGIEVPGKLNYSNEELSHYIEGISDTQEEIPQKLVHAVILVVSFETLEN